MNEEAAAGGPGTIRLRLRYLSAVRDRTGIREEEAALASGSRLRDLASWLERTRGLRLPDPLVMATLNGRGWSQYPEQMETVLHDGDEIALFPVVAGG